MTLFDVIGDTKVMHYGHPNLVRMLLTDSQIASIAAAISANWHLVPHDWRKEKGEDEYCFECGQVRLLELGRERDITEQVPVQFKINEENK